MFKNEELVRIENVEIAGFRTAIRGMRNPLDSWDKADSWVDDEGNFHVGDLDAGLAQRLVLAGDEHGKFIRQIYVGFDIILPRYVWTEFDTYGFSPKNSCSTIHTLLVERKPITKDMFVYCELDDDMMDDIIERLTEIQRLYNDPHYREFGHLTRAQLIRRAKALLPEGFLQRRTVATNYSVLRRIYHQRRAHLLPEWVDVVCKWIETLPHSYLITE